LDVDDALSPEQRKFHVRTLQFGSAAAAAATSTSTQRSGSGSEDGESQRRGAVEWSKFLLAFHGHSGTSPSNPNPNPNPREGEREDRQMGIATCVWTERSDHSRIPPGTATAAPLPPLPPLPARPAGDDSQVLLPHAVASETLPDRLMINFALN
jgi:hypothetical protein